MQKLRIYHILSLAGLLAMGITGCSKNYTNPNQATQEEVFENDRAAAGVALGLQRIYSTSAAGAMYAMIDANGIITKELKVLNIGNVGEALLEAGGDKVDPTNNVVTNIWTNSNKIIFDANNVISYGKKLSDKGYAAGLISFASIYKALSIGNMSMFWQQIPDTIGSNVTFIPRNDGFKKAIAAIDEGLAAFNAAPMSATIKGRLPADVDIKNTLYALKARYLLFSGDYDGALAAANEVNLTVKSTMSFTPQYPNAVFAASAGVFAPVDSTLGLPEGLKPPPDLSDKRVLFYARLDAAGSIRWNLNGFFKTSTTPIPLYLPGEMTLIKAEAYVRKSTPDLNAALTELNKVVTKTPAQDPFGVAAELPALVGPFNADQLLTQIYRNRCLELYMSGLKLEDMRRFGRPESERRRNFFPYPFRERDNNPNTPADPQF